MSDNGYVLAFRRVWQHPVFRDLLDAGIWNYLYQNAAWRDTRVFTNGTRVELRRGQIFVSLRGLAEGFCCAEPRVRRLINDLHADAMIEVLPTHRGTIITICNYEDYQGAQITADALNDTPPTPRPRTGDAPIIKKETNTTNKINSSSYLPEFESFWSTYPKNNGSKKDAARAYERVTTKGVTHETILDGARRYAAYISAKPDGAQFTKHGSAWLNGHFWESEWSINPPGGSHVAGHATKSKFQLALEATERARTERERRASCET
ncbi:hypothetical protein [Limnoglobus roseus]|uniref:Replication protein n=1 Tax=Limnoglobus roseus TaxID=2598579 RepID=A0A5C1ACD6_9BACT|nr:hypothetical protein [Limnoglobus roseus]QEL14764.1 hypothetical protein PX52LOC_01658 [Limnoglobus roseus]